MDWSEIDTGGLPADTYWRLMFRPRAPGAEAVILPVTFTLAPGRTAGALLEIADRLRKGTTPFYVEEPEIARLEAEARDPARGTTPRRLLGWMLDPGELARVRNDGAEDPLGQITAVGAPVAAIATGRRLEPEIIAPLWGAEAPPAILGILDDGIGFLHAAFRSDRTHTRLREVWLMADKPAPETPPGSPATGRVLTRAEIDAFLASGREEADIYREVNDSLSLMPWDHRGTARAFGHGTHVLSRAILARGPVAGIGAGGTAAPRAPEILAVQLRPGSVAVASGRDLPDDMIRGLRWIVERAIAIGKAEGRFVPLIVNFSLGLSGGRQDGTDEVSAKLAEDAAYYEAQTGQPMRVVASFGNERRSRMTARAVLQPGEGTDLTWRLPPDNRLDAWLEVRNEGGAVGLTLTPPPGSGGAPVTVEVGGPMMPLVLSQPGQVPVAQVMAAPTEAGCTLIVLGATEAMGLFPPAPSGGWTLGLRTSGKEAATVRLSLRRGDTPAGYRMAGRQSRLDHPAGWTWEAETRGWTAPAPECPVTREGTSTQLTGTESGSLWLVGALERDDTQGGLRPAPYSASGLPGSGPALSVLVDEQLARRGTLGAGTLTGQTARLSGTSAAAAEITRRALGCLVQGGHFGLAAKGPVETSDLAELGGPVPVRNRTDPLRGRLSLNKVGPIDAP